MDKIKKLTILKKDLEFMPNFYERYITLIDEKADLITELHNTKNIFEKIKNKLIEFQNFKYRPEKWTPKDILQHIIDNERITAYRALCLSRGESKKLMGYDENHYGMNSNANDRSMESLLEEFKLVRQSLILLFENFNKKMLFKTGICNEIKINPLALGFFVIGHCKHHINILKERYFKNS